MERSEIRGGDEADRSFPDYAALHPGYRLRAERDRDGCRKKPPPGSSDEDRVLRFVVDWLGIARAKNMRREKEEALPVTRHPEVRANGSGPKWPARRQA